MSGAFAEKLPSEEHHAPIPTDVAEGNCDTNEGGTFPGSSQRVWRILLVEDNPGDAFLVRKLLTKGFNHLAEISTAESLRQAKEKLADSSLFDAVLLDLSLPDSQGPETFGAVHSLSPRVPVIVLTGQKDRDTARKLLDLGAYSYVRKDELTESVLFNTVYGCLRRAEVEQQLIGEKAAADAANEEKTRFLGKMSHELRTPLTAILGFADLMKIDRNLPANSRAQVDRIAKNASQLHRLIIDLLDFSKLHNGVLDIVIEDVDLKEFLSDIFHTHEIFSAKKDLVLSVETFGLVPSTIRTDPFRLKQVLSNLLTNAIKYTDDGQISLIVKYCEPLTDAAPTLVIEVSDEGRGIPEEMQPRLFQAYSRLEARDRDGSGIGLAVSRGIAVLLEGTIELTSSSSEGSTFTVTLPVREQSRKMMALHLSSNTPQAVAESVGEAATSSDTIPKNLRILLVEDNPDMRFLIATMLKRISRHVRTAKSGSSAIEKAMRGNFDLIFLDLNLPDIDGRNVARALREHGITTPICALTGHALEEIREEAMRAGCDDFLTKPTSVDQLRSITETLYGLRPNSRTH